MKIAQVITLYRPDFVGGATLVADRLARGLRARGHDVAVFCGRPHADAAPYETATWDVGGVPVTGVNVASGFVLLDRRNYRHPEVDAVFARFLERERPDVVHAHSIQALGASVLEVADARGIPIVVTMHDFWWFCARLFLVDPASFVCPPRVAPERCHCAPGYEFVERRRYLAAELARAARVLTPSRLLADAAIANGVARQRVEVSPNGIVAPKTPPRRRPGALVFGYFGGADNRVKGLPTLLRAASELDVGGWQLRLFGVEGDDARVPAVIADRVVTAPAFAPERLAEVLAGLDCLVVPSLARESYSLATREALAAGVPVIVSDGGGASEVVRPGANGFVFATADATDLAAAMRRIVLTPALLDGLRAGAAETTVPSVEEQVLQVERVYREVVAAKRRPVDAAAVPASTAHDPDDAPSAPAPQRARSAYDVLFIAGIDGAPLRYRVLNLQDQLAVAGLTSRLCYHTDPEIPSAIAAAAIVVMYRVPLSGYGETCVAEARRLDRRLVFSCDDLVFDPAAIPRDVLARLPEAQRAGALAYAERYGAMLAACDAFLGATEPLVDAAARAGVPGFVARNGLGRAQLAVAEAVVKQRLGTSMERDGSTLRLAYFSGTTTHDLDFASIEPALVDILATYPEVRLVLGGYLRPGAALAPFGSRIERLPFLPWQTLLATLASIDVNLAPLRTPEEFADAKSEVKYLEAGVVGVPTVATPTAAFRHAIRDGENGLLARTTLEWSDALEALVVDTGLRRRLANAARDDVFVRYTPQAQADTLVAVLGAIGALPRRDVTAAMPADDGRGPHLDAGELAQRHPGEIGRYALEPTDAVPGVAQPSHDTPSPFLVAGRVVGQSFVAAADDLIRIDVRIGTDGKTLGATITVHLGERPGAGAKDLRTVVLRASDFPDQAWIAAEFAPLAASGRTLYVWIESDAADARQAPTLWTSTTGWGEPAPDGLFIDHRPAAGALTFRTFHRRGH